MKDVTRQINLILPQYMDKCKHSSGGVCKNPSGCQCQILADVWGYISSYIPTDCQKLDLWQFNGTPPNSQKRVLDPDTVISARKAVATYCWGSKGAEELEEGKYKGLRDDPVKWAKASVIDFRKSRGHSVVIHGDQLVNVKAKGGKRDLFDPAMTKKYQVGKTMMASIIMKEVFKRRMFSGHISDTYEWVSFGTLKSRAMDDGNTNAINYKTCDWLVVDDIPQKNPGSDNMRSYMFSKLDSVFTERTDQGLPTILLFEFNVDSEIDLGSAVGAGIADIVAAKTTFKICLDADQNE